MPAIVEGWIDKVLAPPWAFRFKQLVGNYGYPIGNLRKKKAVIFCTYGSPRLAITTFFLNLPIRRLKRGVFHYVRGLRLKQDCKLICFYFLLMLCKLYLNIF